MKYQAQIAWSGSTGLGWENYDRTHTARVGKQELTLTTGEALGDPDLANPEQILLAAASSCQMLWFLHLAAKSRIDVVSYEDACQAEMPQDRLTRIVLRPRIAVKGDFNEDRLLHLCELAHRECNVAKSLATPVELEPLLARAP